MDLIIGFLDGGTRLLVPNLTILGLNIYLIILVNNKYIDSLFIIYSYPCFFIFSIYTYYFIHNTYELYILLF